MKILSVGYKGTRERERRGIGREEGRDRSNYYTKQAESIGCYNACISTEQLTWLLSQEGGLIATV